MDAADTRALDDASVLSRWEPSVDHMAEFVLEKLEKRPGKSLTMRPELCWVFDFGIPKELLRAFVECSKGGDVVYFCGTTDNKDGISHELKLGYAMLLERGTDAYVGVWLHNGDTFIDSVMIPDNCWDDETAISYMIRHGQRCVSRVTVTRDENGNITSVDADTVGE